jgi:NAD(P)-dependent dehydrogenase (short-subunit alcohol dehydrogenase family)
VTLSLESSVAVVTGAGRGIGAAVAATLAREGAAVALASRSTRELEAVAEAIVARGGRACAIPADVRDPEAAGRLLAEAEARLGPVDLLVNNAGVCHGLGAVWTAEPDAWWDDVETSLRGAFLCTRAALPPMLDRRRGRIVYMTSYAAIRPAPRMSGYAAAKAALVHLTGSLAEELRDSGVCAFAVAPGTVRTRMTEEMLSTRDGRRFFGRTDPDRWVEPERAGELVAYIATGDADRLSGRLLHVLDDVPGLARRAEEVERDDLLTLRLRRPAALTSG